MGRKAKYLEVEESMVKQDVSYKKRVESYSLAKKINKSTNLEIYNLIDRDQSEKSVKEAVRSSMYLSRPSYQFWREFTNGYQAMNKSDIYKLLVISDSIVDHNFSFSILRTIFKFEKDYLRPLSLWRPKTRNPYLQLISLIRHLFTKYETPTFLEKYFEKEDGMAIRLYIHMGAGKSMKNYGGYPEGLIIHNKAAHYLYTTPDDMDYFLAFRRIQVLYMGGDDYIFKALMRSRILNTHFRYRPLDDPEEFWLTVIKFFIDNRMIEPDKIAEIIDYINYIKFPAVGHVIPEHPNFTMKGRNPMTLIALSDNWHYERERLERLNRPPAARGVRGYYVSPQTDFSWIGNLDIKNREFRKQKIYTYKIIQLKTYFDLRDEGNEMHHCVATYANLCKGGSCSIFSVRQHLNGSFTTRTATIEVRANQVVQIRGKYNRKPDDTTIGVIKEWAEYEHLTTSKYAL